LGPRLHPIVTMEAAIIQIPDPSSASGGLVARARGGDFSAYERLYHQHVGRIHGLCMRMTANRGEAEDMTQQTFIRAWEKLDTFRGEAGFGAWLRKIAVNFVLSERRSGRRRYEHTVEDIQVVEPAEAPRPAPVGGGVDLDRAIALLPERARLVFILHDVEGFRHHEIGDRLGIAEGTSKSQLHHARRILREALNS